MTIGMGVWAFVVYISFVILYNVVIKRPISEAMFLGLLIACAFSGISKIPQTLYLSMLDASQTSAFLAIMLFVVMSTIMAKTGIIGRLVHILNSLIGKVRGGPAYVSTCASAMFGLVSGSGSGNAATVGAITIPWMVRSGWPREVTATINSGNAGLGISFPASSSMFMMLGFATVAESVNIGNLYFALLCGGLWTLLSPPSSSPIFISCGIAEVSDIPVTFKPLVFHYVIPVVLIGVLVALGYLPLFHG